MKIGLIDVDGHNFPNLALMKLSAWHKAHGDSVEWYQPLISGKMDIVYMSKVFTFTDDYIYPIDADRVISGGTGYNDMTILPDVVEHIMPDYSIYNINDTAFGFLTRGCPRGCGFCIVKQKEGGVSHKVADLSEFYNGQKNIVLLDPNMFSCKDWEPLAEQLILSGAWVEFNQGVDIRTMTEEKAKAINRMKLKRIHFAWDRYEDGPIVLKNLEMYKRITGANKSNCMVYVLTNYDTTNAQDLERIMKIREIGVDPFVMVYDKLNAPRITRKLQRWVNAKQLFYSTQSFAEYYRGDV